MITWDKDSEKLYLDDEEGLFAIEKHEGYASPALWERIDALQKAWHAPDGHNEGKGSTGDKAEAPR